MTEWTRRRLMVAGVSSAATLACASGAGPASDGAPGAVPAPAGDPSWKGGTLFRPHYTPDKSSKGPSEEMPDDGWGAPPDWFRAAPAVFCPMPRSGGSCLMLMAEGQQHLGDDISSFRDLPKLLDQARALGTDVIYLIDWYEGAEGEPPHEYLWNKGDYVPRADLGGEEALKKGLAAVQAKGGRVLSYLELFTIAKRSDIGKRKGKQWSLKTDEGFPKQPYPDAWKCCPNADGFVDHIVGVARRIVGDYGFDGLHCDSYGYQRGWKCVGDHGHAKGKGAVFNQGAIELVHKVHDAIVDEKSDAALMIEGPRYAEMFAYATACQDWHVGDLLGRWLWDRGGFMSVFTAHWTLDDLHQIVAVGHKLSLGGHFWHEAPMVPSARAWLDKALPKQLKDRQDDRFRRFYIEEYARELHKWRNAGILLGRPVPNIDEATPRRWDRKDAFEDFEGLKNLVAQMRDAADEVDRALEGADELPAPTAHVETLSKARQAWDSSIRNSRPTVVDDAGGGDEVLVYRFKGAGAPAWSAVNVGNQAATVEIKMKGGRIADHVSGQTHEVTGGTLTLALAPHSVALLSRA